MLVSNIGYTRTTFDTLGSGRSVPDWWDKDATQSQEGRPIPTEITQLPTQEVLELKEAFSRLFCRRISNGDNHFYKLTTAIAELHLGEIVGAPLRFAGILYPSVRMNGNGDNVALQPWFVEQGLAFCKASHIRINSRTDTGFEIDRLNEAFEFEPDGTLRWLGRLKHWTLGAGRMAKATVIEGVDDDGDYSTGANGERLHWQIVDETTGSKINAA